MGFHNACHQAASQPPARPCPLLRSAASHCHEGRQGSHQPATARQGCQAASQAGWLAFGRSCFVSLRKVASSSQVSQRMASRSLCSLAPCPGWGVFASCLLKLLLLLACLPDFLGLRATSGLVPSTLATS
jgi:hypothetical protein